IYRLTLAAILAPRGFGQAVDWIVCVVASGIYSLIVVEDRSQGGVGDSRDVAYRIIRVVKILDTGSILEDLRAPSFAFPGTTRVLSHQAESHRIVFVRRADAVAVVDTGALRTRVVIDASDE